MMDYLYKTFGTDEYSNFGELVIYQHDFNGIRKYDLCFYTQSIIDFNDPMTLTPEHDHYVTKVTNVLKNQFIDVSHELDMIGEDGDDDDEENEDDEDDDEEDDEDEDTEDDEDEDTDDADDDGEVNSADGLIVGNEQGYAHDETNAELTQIAIDSESEHEDDGVIASEEDDDQANYLIIVFHITEEYNFNESNYD